jgi:hypothetical protein
MASIQRQLARVRRRLEGARLYAGFTGSSNALDTVARLERIYWRLDRLLQRAERKAA